MKSSKSWLVWVVLIVFVAFIGMNVYQFSYPDWWVKCVGGSFDGQRPCVYDYTDVERFIDDAEKRGNRSCTVERSKKCQTPWLTPSRQ